MLGNRETPRLQQRSGGNGILILAAKIVVSAGCFWYVLARVDLAALGQALEDLNLRWSIVAVALVMLSIPLAGIRWSVILNTLARDERHIPRMAVMNATAVGLFFAQVAPNVVGEVMRTWLIIR